MSSNPVKDQTTKRAVRILLKWRGKIINFGKINFRTDGSLVFSPAFHSNKDKYPTITTGKWNDNDQIEKPESTVVNDLGGIHISLHPRDQVLHIRQNASGPILSSKSMQWFPVIEPFLLIRAISPPLDECVGSNKEKDFCVVVPDEYSDSIEIWVRVFPWAENPMFKFQEEALGWIMGFHRKHYWVACGVFKSDSRSAPAVLYPDEAPNPQE